jgi:hypothetical protein
MSEASRRETNIVAAEVLTAIGQLPKALRETALLVCGEGYAEAAKHAENPDRRRDGPPRRRQIAYRA